MILSVRSNSPFGTSLGGSVARFDTSEGMFGMDGQRFDDVARLIGTGASRRRVIKGIFAGALGLGGVSALRPGASAGGCILTGQSCVDNGDACCDGSSVCAGVPRMCYSTTSCVGETGGCNTDTGPDCCSGMECVATDGFNGSCVACGQASDGCTTDDDCCGDLFCAGGTCGDMIPSCEDDGDCPGGYICCDSGDGLYCIANECCGPDDPIHCDNETEFCTDEKICVLLEGRDECQEDSDCFEINGESEIAPICCGGVCAQIECCTDDEDPNARCGEGTSCFEGYCDPFCTSDDHCASDTCCCQDGTCFAECCDSTEEPVDEPELPVVLPNTGIGGDSGNGALLGAGLLAAGAAYLAGKKLQTGEES